jgi:hypothetical protein
MLVRRLKTVMDEEGMDEQPGFRHVEELSIDFCQLAYDYRNAKITYFESWILLVVLVKAFDTLPREALFEILRSYGLPNHFLNIIVRLTRKKRSRRRSIE